MSSAHAVGDAQKRALRLVTSQQPLIQAYARVICRDPALADDAAQEVAVDLLAKCDRLPPPEAEIPWLKRVVRNKCLQQLRKQRRHQPLGEHCLEDLGDRVEEAVGELPRLQAALRRCLGEMGDDVRRLLDERYRAGRDAGGMAAQLGLTVQALYSRLKRLRQLLRQCVDRQLATEAP